MAKITSIFYLTTKFFSIDNFIIIHARRNRINDRNIYPRVHFGRNAPFYCSRRILLSSMLLTNRGSFFNYVDGYVAVCYL